MATTEHWKVVENLPATNDMPFGGVRIQRVDEPATLPEATKGMTEAADNFFGYLDGLFAPLH